MTAVWALILRVLRSPTSTVIAILAGLIAVLWTKGVIQERAARLCESQWVTANREAKDTSLQAEIAALKKENQILKDGNAAARKENDRWRAQQAAQQANNERFRSDIDGLRKHPDATQWLDTDPPSDIRDSVRTADPASSDGTGDGSEADPAATTGGIRAADPALHHSI